MELPSGQWELSVGQREHSSNSLWNVYVRSRLPLPVSVEYHSGAGQMALSNTDSGRLGHHRRLRPRPLHNADGDGCGRCRAKWEHYYTPDCGPQWSMYGRIAEAYRRRDFRGLYSFVYATAHA